MNTETFKAIEFAKKLIIVLEKDLYNFPNKYLELKTRILSTAYDILELGYIANSIENTKNKNAKKVIPYLTEILAKIKMMDFLIDTSFELKLLGSRKYRTIGNLLSDVEKYSVGWYKYLNIK